MVLVNSRKIGRRRLFQSAALGSAALTAAEAFGCGGTRRQANSTGSGGAAKQSAGQPKRGGMVTFAGGRAGSYDIQGRSFDPEIQTQFGAKSYTLFYERLLAYDLKSYAIGPELAQKWEEPSQTEYVFHLQPGVKWQNKPPVNGRPLTSQDIVWTLNRARTDDPKFYSRSL